MSDRVKPQAQFINPEPDERFADVFEQAAVGMALVGLDGRWLRANQRLCDILQYGQDEITALTFQDLTYPADLNPASVAMRQLLGGQTESCSLEKRYVRKDGSLVWVNLTVSAARSPDGHPAHFIFVVEDITARRHAEERARTLADGIPHLCWMADPDGYITWYNRRWLEYTGRGYEQMKGLKWVPVLDPAVQPKVLERWLESIESGRAFEMEFPIRAKDGSFRPFITRAEPVLDDTGRIVRWFGTDTDITERKLAEEALKEADRRKNEFLATLAHELRNPLAPMGNAVQILELSDDPQDQAEARNMIRRQLEQMVRLVDDLLDVSRISTGKLQLRKEPLPLAVIIERAVEISRPMIDKMGHTLKVSGADDASLIVDADAARLTQVISNLLNNAAKYTDRGGQIWLSVERHGDEASVAVKDTGVGIAADQLPSLFNMFAQVSSTLERSQGGLGIGLPLAKRLVEMHGGRIGIKSDGPGKGSEFRIHLPLVARRETAVPPAEATLRRTSLRILIVDDNADGARSLGLLLRLNGNDIRTASDGPAALSAADEFRPDVVLMDIGLPGMNGYEVCRRLRTQPRGPGMVMVAVTGYGAEEDQRQAVEAGFDHHFVKPIDFQALMSLLSERQARSGR